MFGTDNINETTRIIPNRNFISGCILEKISIDKDQNGKETLDFNFKQKSTGGILRHREFDPSEKQVGVTDDKHKQQITWTMGRIRHIMGRFMNEKNSNIPNIATWSAFIREVGKRMKAANYSSTECTLKVVYNNKGYSSFPMFPDFISTETYPKDFEIDPVYDKFEKPGGENSTTNTPTTEEEEEEDPFGEKDDDETTEAIAENSSVENAEDDF